MKVICTCSSFAFCVCWSNCSSVKGVEGSTSLSSSRDVAKEPQPTRAESPNPGIPQAVPRNDSKGGSSRSPRSRPSRPPGSPPPRSPEAGGPGPATFQKMRTNSLFATSHTFHSIISKGTSVTSIKKSNFKNTTSISIGVVKL